MGYKDCLLKGRKGCLWRSSIRTRARRASARCSFPTPSRSSPAGQTLKRPAAWSTIFSPRFPLRLPHTGSSRKAYNEGVPSVPFISKRS